MRLFIPTFLIKMMMAIKYMDYSAICLDNIALTWFSISKRTRKPAHLSVLQVYPQPENITGLFAYGNRRYCVNPVKYAIIKEG